MAKVLFQVAFLAVVVVSILGATTSRPPRCRRDHDCGRPACRTQEELNQRRWRNNWDPTRFWVCERLNQPARSVSCYDSEEGGDLFLNDWKMCVNWDEWYWTPTCKPPSWVTCHKPTTARPRPPTTTPETTTTESTTPETTTTESTTPETTTSLVTTTAVETPTTEPPTEPPTTTTEPASTTTEGTTTTIQNP